MSEHIQLLDDLEAEFVRVSNETEQQAETRSGRVRRALRPGTHVRAVAVAVTAAVTIAGTAYAVPATRTVVSGIGDSLAAWVSGNAESAPGRAVQAADNAPRWFTEVSGEDRLIAENEGVGLFVRKFESNGGTMIAFAMGPGLRRVGTIDDWRQSLGQNEIVVLGHSIFRGPGQIVDDKGRLPLFGVTSSAVRHVELQYADGPPLRADNGDGGFVLLVDTWRPMRQVVAYDSAGQELGRADVSNYDLRSQCLKQPGCPPEGTPLP